jgi:hypothetical protein
LGDFRIGDRLMTDILVEEGYAVRYNGGNKEELEIEHLRNRENLINSNRVQL